MDKLRKLLKRKGKRLHKGVWKIGMLVHRYPQALCMEGFSTGGVDNFLWKRWKSWGKMFKTPGHFLELILVMMAFTVSAKAGSFFIFFSTCSMEWRTVV